jgi:hypothetical protein
LFIERAVFNCLEDEEGEYEELDDNFLLLANEGQPALVIASVEEEKPEYANKGVVIVKDEVEE